MQESPRFVYVVGAVGVQAVKIGSASDCIARLSTLQVGCPLPLVLLWQQESRNAYAVEKALQVHFAEHKVRGEWFDLGVDPLPKIKDVFTQEDNIQPSLFESPPEIEILTPHQRIRKEILHLLDTLLDGEEFIQGFILADELLRLDYHYQFDRSHARMSQDIAAAVSLPIEQVVVDGKQVKGYHACNLRALLERD
jgi:hypothetical protein